MESRRSSLEETHLMWPILVPTQAGTAFIQESSVRSFLLRTSFWEAMMQCRAGHAGQAIIQAATEGQCDLLVLGRSGHSEVWGRFMGSTANKVSRHAPCSVLIVH